MQLRAPNLARPLLVLVALALPAAALAQSTTSNEIDACGILVHSGGCVIFEGGGGRLVIAPQAAEGFAFGDAVRAVGTVDPNCVAICDDIDGCIRGAVLYDPAVFPCGARLPNFPGDIVTNACTAATAALFTLTVVGLTAARGRRARVLQTPPEPH